MPNRYFGRTHAPAPHGEVRRARIPGRLHGDVGRGVPDAEHHDPLAGEHLGSAVVVRVDLLAREVLAARERRLGPARVPVVTVGDQHVVVVPGRDRARVVARPDRDVPPTALRGCHLGHLGTERDRVAEREVVDEVVEVLGDLPVARVVWQARRHRPRGVLHPLARGVDVQRAVRRADAVVVLVAPVAADPRAHLEAVEVDPLRLQHLGRSDPRRPGSDDAGGGMPRLMSAEATRRRPAPVSPPILEKTRNKSPATVDGE